MQAELWEKEITIRKKDDTIREKEMTIREKEDIIREKEDIIREKENVIRKKENTIREKEDLIWKRENDIRRQMDAVKEKHEELKKANCDVQQLKEVLARKDEEIKTLKKIQEDVNEKVVELQKENKELELQVQGVNGKMAELQKENKELKTQVKKTECEVKQLKQVVMNRDNEVKSLTAVNKIHENDAMKQVEEANRSVQRLKQYLTTKEDEIKSCKEASSILESKVKKLEQTKDQLKETLDDKMTEIFIYQNKIADLESENVKKNESLKDLKKKMADAKKENEKIIKDLQKREEKLNRELQKEKEKHKKVIEAKYQFEDEYTKLKKETRRLSSFEKAYYTVEKQITDAGLEIGNQQRTIQSQEKTIQRQLSEIIWYRNENDTKAQMILSLEDEKESLLLRLSKTPDAQLTVSNPDIADLSDDKRPSKLAEEFSELYDNEWTDAFECIEAEGDDEKTQVLYDLLKHSYEFCDTLSTRHYEAIIKSFTTLNYSMKFLKQNIDVKNSNMLSNRQDITDEVRTLANKENASMDQTVQNYSQSSVKNTARSKPPSETQHTEAEVTADTKEQLIAERECVEKRNDVTEVTVSELMFNFDDFSAEQKKNLLDLRKLCEEKQANDVVQVGSKLIATEMQIENGEIMKYISKCIDICWSMCRHTPPVFIDYSKCEEGLPFDQQKYRPYTKSGKFVRFVVWPTLYLHTGGPQLSKGVAQGRN